MAASRFTFTLLIVAGLVVATTIALDRFPEMSLDLLERVLRQNLIRLARE